MTGEDTGVFFYGNGNTEDSEWSISMLVEEGAEEINFPAAYALLADRPEQQARLAAMKMDPHPQPSGDAAKG